MNRRSFLLFSILAAAGIFAALPALQGKPEERRAPLSDIMQPPAGHRTLASGWPAGSTIHVYFKNGKASRRTAVMNCANEWTRHGNFQFQWHPEPMPAGVHAIHIEFWEGGGRSLLGSGSYSPAYASMHLPLEDEDCTTTLHEFGHALGLLHEFQNPDSLRYLRPITEQTYERISMSLGWSRAEADANLIKRVVPPGREKPFDPLSVMGYSTMALMDLYDGKVETEPGPELSAGDKAYIRRVYPGRVSPPIVSTVVFVDPPDMVPEQTKTITWTGRGLTLTVPKSFQVRSMNAEGILLSNPAETSQVLIRAQATPYEALDARGLAVRQTLLGGSVLSGHTEALSGSESKDGQQTGFRVFETQGLSQGKMVAWLVRVAGIHFTNSRAHFTATFVCVKHDLLKEQIEEMMKSMAHAGNASRGR